MSFMAVSLVVERLPALARMSGVGTGFPAFLAAPIQAVIASCTSRTASSIEEPTALRSSSSSPARLPRPCGPASPFGLRELVGVLRRCPGRQHLRLLAGEARCRCWCDREDSNLHGVTH